APAATRGVRPPTASLGRSVVATRPPRVVPAAAEPSGGAQRVSAPAPRIVTPAPARETYSVAPRPPFGQSSIERPVTTVRPQPPPATHVGARCRPAPGARPAGGGRGGGENSRPRPPPPPLPLAWGAPPPDAACPRHFRGSHAHHASALTSNGDAVRSADSTV